MAAKKQKAARSVETAAGEAAPERFTVKEIFHEVAFEELVSRGLKFTIVGHNRQNFSMFDVMPVEITQDDLFHLMEDINEVVLLEDAKFKRKPKKLDVVLAKKSDTQKYHRCFITDCTTDSTDEEYAEVYWIDVGGIGTVPFKDLMPVNADIMSHPRLAYTVVLQDGCEISNYILLAEFEKLMLKFRGVEFTVELGEQNPLGGKLYTKMKVKMTFKDSPSTVVDLRDEINKLQKWEWETFSNLKGNDDEINANGKWGLAFRTSFKDQFPFTYILQPKVDRFSATVSRVFRDEQNPEIAKLHIILLDNQLCYNYFNVLHHQLERYAVNIKKSKFFPAFNEPLLFKLHAKEEYKKNVKCLDRWMRAIRVDKEILYLFDVDDFVPFAHLPEEDYEMRPLYYEFFKVPALSMVVRPTNKEGGAIEFAAAKKIFKEGKRFHFAVSKDKNDKSPYEVHFSKPLNDKEKKLTIASFLATYKNKELEKSTTRK